MDISILLSLRSVASAASATVSFPWNFDPITGDSWSVLSFGSHGEARVTWDTGSGPVAVAVAGARYQDLAQSVLPGMVEPYATVPVVPQSQIDAHFGSGGYEGSMATANLSVVLAAEGGTVPARVPLRLAAIHRIDTGGFPVGGPARLQGIVGLSWPNPPGLGVMTLPPFCTGGSSPSVTPAGSRTCNPATGVEPSVPLLQQLSKAASVPPTTPLLLTRNTITMRFQGSTIAATRHGTVVLGAEAPAAPLVLPGYALLPLQKAWGIAYVDNYVVRVPSLAVGGVGLNFTEEQLAGGSVVRGNHYGGWVVDSGTCFMSMPPVVLNATLSELEQRYRAAGGTLTAAKLDALLGTGRVFDGDGRQPPYVGSVLTVSAPCVVISPDEARGLPTITISLAGAHVKSSEPVLEYTPDMYLYQPLPATQPRCMQLGFSGNNQGIIGSLNIQGYTVYIDQDNKQIAFATNAAANTDGGGCAVGTGCAIGLGVGLGLGMPLLAGLVYAATRRGQYKYGRTRAMLSGNAASFNDDRTGAGVGQAPPSSFGSAGAPKARAAPDGYGSRSLEVSHDAL